MRILCCHVSHFRKVRGFECVRCTVVHSIHTLHRYPDTVYTYSCVCIECTHTGTGYCTYRKGREPYHGVWDLSLVPIATYACMYTPGYMPVIPIPDITA